MAAGVIPVAHIRVTCGRCGAPLDVTHITECNGRLLLSVEQTHKCEAKVDKLHVVKG